MRGITEERVKEIIKERLCYDESIAIEDYILPECKELNEWQPIETSPKDRMLLIWDDNYGHCTACWNEFYQCFTAIQGHKYHQPTHWMELPDPPTASQQSEHIAETCSPLVNYKEGFITDKNHSIDDIQCCFSGTWTEKQDVDPE